MPPLLRCISFWIFSSRLSATVFEIFVFYSFPKILVGFFIPRICSAWYIAAQGYRFQLPLTTPPHILTGSSSILDIDHVKEQPSRASQIMRYGYPGFDNLRTFEDYVLSYDRRNRLLHISHVISIYRVKYQTNSRKKFEIYIFC